MGKIKWGSTDREKKKAGKYKPKRDSIIRWIPDTEAKRIQHSEAKPEGVYRPLEEVGTIVEPIGSKFNPIENLSVLVMVDMSARLKRRRRVPQFFYLKRAVNFIGTGARAHIKIDDLEQVKPEHAAITFQDGKFWIYPQEGSVTIDGISIPSEGDRLRNGSHFEVGSAKFVFLTILDSIEDSKGTL